MNPNLSVTVDGVPVSAFRFEHKPPFPVLIVLDGNPLLGGEDIQLHGQTQAEPEVWVRYPYRTQAGNETWGHLRFRSGSIHP